MSGPLSDLDGPLGVEARTLVALLNPHPATLEHVEGIVAHVAESTGPSTVAALRQIVGLAIARSSAISLLPPRADHVGEHVSGRREPDL